MLASLQRRLLYFPVHQDLARAITFARQVGLEPLMAAGRFLGWRARHHTASPSGIVLVLHGNAGTALDRLPFRDVFQGAGPVDVVLLEYPGYGPREGKPSQRTLVDAACEAVTLLRMEGVPVAVIGESLGSAVGALAAAELPADVAGLLLITPLASVTAVAKRHFPLVPSMLVRDAYHADRALPRYPGPVGFLVAGRDEVVFPELGLALFEARTGPKRLWLEPEAGHNNVRYDPSAPRWREMLELLFPR